MSVRWSEREKRGRRTWVIDTARGLAELERRLNRLDGDGFRVHEVLIGLEPAFEIVAFRYWSPFLRWLPAWLLHSHEGRYSRAGQLPRQMIDYR